MKKTIISKKTFVLVILTALLVHMQMAYAQVPQLTVQDHLEVPDVGMTFDVNITLVLPEGVTITNLKGWQIKLGYNTTILDCIGAALLPGHPFENITVSNPAPTIDETSGTVLYMCITMQPTDYVNVTETKPLCKITFNSTGIGVSPLEFQRLNLTGGTYLINKDGIKLAFEPIPGDVTVISEFQPILLLPIIAVATATIALLKKKLLSI